MAIDYALDEKIAALGVTADVVMLPRSEALREYAGTTAGIDAELDVRHAIFRHVTTASVPLGVEAKRESNVIELAEDGGRILKQALDESALQVARALVKQLEMHGT